MLVILDWGLQDNILWFLEWKRFYVSGTAIVIIYLQYLLNFRMAVLPSSGISILYLARMGILSSIFEIVLNF